MASSIRTRTAPQVTLVMVSSWYWQTLPPPLPMTWTAKLHAKLHAKESKGQVACIKTRLIKQAHLIKEQKVALMEYVCRISALQEEICVQGERRLARMILKKRGCDRQ